MSLRNMHWRHGRRRSVRRGVRAAEHERVQRDLRVHRQRILEPPHVPAARTVRIRQETNYPWDGNIRLFLNGKTVGYSRRDGLTTVFQSGMFDGVQVIRGRTIARSKPAVGSRMETNGLRFTAIPYFAWTHRGPGPVAVYWFDDTGRGECRVPDSWRILYGAGREWKPVYTEGTYGIDKDRFTKLVFETVRTHAIRLEIQSRNGFAGGIHEIKVQ